MCKRALLLRKSATRPLRRAGSFAVPCMRLALEAGEKELTLTWNAAPLGDAVADARLVRPYTRYEPPAAECGALLRAAGDTKDGGPAAALVGTRYLIAR